MNTNKGILVSVRVNPHTMETINTMVSNGTAINRSDAMRIILDRSIGQEEKVTE